MNIFNFTYFNFQPSYSLGERILRTSVFQIGVANGTVEWMLMWLYSAITQRSLFPERFDEERAQRGLKSFINLGGEVEFIEPKDGRAKIQVMHLRSADLEEKLHEFG